MDVSFDCNKTLEEHLPFYKIMLQDKGNLLYQKENMWLKWSICDDLIDFKWSKILINTLPVVRYLQGHKNLHYNYTIKILNEWC